MEARLKPYEVAPHLMQPMVALEKSVAGSGLEYSLIELVKTRASQINGCAYCLHLHTRDARAHGELEERLYLLNAWREAPLYSARERAALEWTEALTQVATTHAPDEAYEVLGPHFTAEETVALTLLITTINAWNRIAVGFRMVHSVAEAESGAR